MYAPCTLSAGECERLAMVSVGLGISPGPPARYPYIPTPIRPDREINQEGVQVASPHLSSLVGRLLLKGRLPLPREPLRLGKVRGGHLLRQRFTGRCVFFLLLTGDT